MVAEQHAPIGGAQARNVPQVLYTQRQAVQRPERAALHRGGIAGPGGGAGAVEIAGHHGVHGWVDGEDAGNAAFDQLDGGQPLAADQPAGFDGVEIARFHQGNQIPSAPLLPARIRWPLRRGAGFAFAVSVLDRLGPPRTGWRCGLRSSHKSWHALRASSSRRAAWP